MQWLLMEWLELNEAMLTGESDPILKKDGKELLSGSYLVSGQVYAKVINVAEDNYANKLMLEAKTHKPIVSCILYNMDKIAKFTGKDCYTIWACTLFQRLT